MSSKIKLPSYPSVEARENAVVVCFENGNDLLWGEESSAEDALKTAKELELELRAVNYLKWHVHNFIKDMKEILKSLDIDEGLLDSILVDGHDFARESVSQSTVDSIVMGADHDLRKQVLENLGSDDFIV